MGLDIAVLRNPTYVKPLGNASDDDYDRYTVVYNVPAFASSLDGRPSGFYDGELERHHPRPSWSYSGYNYLRELLCRAAFGVSPRVIWDDPDTYKGHKYGGLVPLVNFSDCEGALGPETCRTIADALEHLPLPTLLDRDERDYAERGRALLLASLRDAADHAGFALWE